MKTLAIKKISACIAVLLFFGLAQQCLAGWSYMDGVDGYAPDSLESIWAPADGTAFAVGGIQARMQLKGETWSNRPHRLHTWLSSVWGVSANNVYAVGGWSLPLLYPPFSVYCPRIEHFNGFFWRTVYLGYDHEFEGVWGSSGRDIFAVGSNGFILHGNGLSWRPMKSGSEQNLQSVWGNSGKDVFAVGEQGTILHYNGSSWSSMESFTEANLMSVWGSSGTDVYAVGFNVDSAGGNSVILHYDGTAWSMAKDIAFCRLYAVWGRSAEDVFAAGSEGTILHYDGSSWSAMFSGTTGRLTGISGGKDVVYATGYIPDGGQGFILEYRP